MVCWAQARVKSRHFYIAFMNTTLVKHYYIIWFVWIDFKRQIVNFNIITFIGFFNVIDHTSFEVNLLSLTVFGVGCMLVPGICDFVTTIVQCVYFDFRFTSCTSTHCSFSWRYSTLSLPVPNWMVSKSIHKDWQLLHQNCSR
jgi:hypothetical protein